MPHSLKPGSTVRLMDRSFGICVSQGPLDDAPAGFEDDYGLMLVPAFPCTELPCLDKVGQERLFGNSSSLVALEDCFYTVLNIDVQALGLTARGARADQPLNIAVRSNTTGAVLITNTRFLEAPSIVKKVKIVEEEVWDDVLAALSAEERREYVAARGW